MSIGAKYDAMFKGNKRAKLFCNIILVWLLSRLIMLIMVPIHNLIVGANPDTSIIFLMNMWDAKHYKYIINHGYTYPTDLDPQANWAFFPLYPILCRLVKEISFRKLSAYICGMIVSNICIIIAAFYGVLYIQENPYLKKSYKRVVKGRKSEQETEAEKNTDLWWVLPMLLFACPYAFYACATYTEALFIMCIVLFFYCLQEKAYISAGFWAMCSSGTRIVGCLLVFAMLVDMYLDYSYRGKLILSKEADSDRNTAADTIEDSNSDKAADTEHKVVKDSRFKNFMQKVKSFTGYILRTPDKLFSILICPLGTFAYMAFLYFFCGDAWAFLHVQIAWRENKFIPVIGVLFKACTGQLELRFTYMGWFCVATLALYVYMFMKKHYSMAVFGIISLLVPLTSHVLSTCRFTMGTFVFYIGVYDLLSKAKRPVRNAIMAALVILEAVMLYFWYCENYWLM